MASTAEQFCLESKGGPQFYAAAGDRIGEKSPISSGRQMNFSIEPMYLDRDQAAQFVNLSGPAMQRLISSGSFPRPRQISARRVAWLVRELREWGESRPVSEQMPPINSSRIG